MIYIMVPIVFAAVRPQYVLRIFFSSVRSFKLSESFAWVPVCI